ncbi:MAG: hypothetical protein ABI371_08210 [Gelidibacter sp.]
MKFCSSGSEKTKHGTQPGTLNPVNKLIGVIGTLSKLFLNYPIIRSIDVVGRRPNDGINF